MLFPPIYVLINDYKKKIKKALLLGKKGKNKNKKN